MAEHQTHTLASHTNRHTSQSLQKSVPAPAPKEFKNIFSSLLKKGKTLHTQSNDRQKSVAIQTPKPLTGKCFNYSVDRRPACNTGLAKVAVQCSADTFVVNQTLVLRINICGENRHLRQARKRYASF